MKLLFFALAIVALVSLTSSNADDKARRRESSRTRRHRDSRVVFDSPNTVNNNENNNEKDGEKQCVDPTTSTSTLSDPFAQQQNCLKAVEHMQLFQAVEHAKTVNGFKQVTVCPGTIEFNGDISFSKGSRVMLRCVKGTSEQDCIFKGLKEYTRFFQVQPGAVLSMRGFTLDSGSAVTNGGSAAKYGGAVYVHEGGAFETSKCIFSNNSGLLGGAIYNNGIMIAKDCEFLDNSAEKSGGATHIENPGTATFTNCIFLNNKAGLSGGALHVNGEVKVEGGVSGRFRGNKAIKGPNISIVSGNLNCLNQPKFCDSVGINGPSTNCPLTPDLNCS